MELISATFLGFTFFVCLFACIKRKEMDVKSCDGYFLAGRNLSGIFIACSFLLTNLSVELLVGTTGQAYSTNMGLMSWEISSALALIVLSYVFLPRYLKMGITTIPEFFEKRYDASLGRFISIIFIVVYIAVVMPSILYSGAAFLEKVIGFGEMLKISHRAAIMLICYIVASFTSLYCYFGALKSTAKADVIYGIGLLFGGLILICLGFLYLGDGDFSNGLNYFLTSSPEKMNSFYTTEKIPNSILFIGVFLHNLFYWCTNQVFVQRIFAARSLKEAQKGAIFSALFKLLGVFYLIIPGIIAYQINPALSSYDTAFPMLIGITVPRVALGFVGAVLLGVTLSAFTRTIHSTVTMFALDIYKPIFYKDASDEQIVDISKKIIILMSFAVTFAMPLFISIGGDMKLYLNIGIGYLNMPVLAAVLAGLLSKKVSAIAAKLTFMFHFFAYTVFLLMPKTINYLIAEVVLFLIDFVVITIVGYILPRSTDFVACDFGKVPCEPWKHAPAFTIITAVISVLLYVIFSPLILAK